MVDAPHALPSVLRGGCAWRGARPAGVLVASGTAYRARARASNGVRRRKREAVQRSFRATVRTGGDRGVGLRRTRGMAASSWPSHPPRRGGAVCRMRALGAGRCAQRSRNARARRVLDRACDGGRLDAARAPRHGVVRGAAPIPKSWGVPGCQFLPRPAAEDRRMELVGQSAFSHAGVGGARRKRALL